MYAHSLDIVVTVAGEKMAEVLSILIDLMTNWHDMNFDIVVKSPESWSYMQDRGLSIYVRINFFISLK